MAGQLIAMEQGTPRWAEVAAQARTGLGYSSAVAASRVPTRPGALQSGYRQQAPWLQFDRLDY